MVELCLSFVCVTNYRYIIERKKVGSGGYGTCHRGLCLRECRLLLLLPLPHCRIESFLTRVFRDWAVCLRKAPQANSWYLHASSATWKTIRHFSLGVETIERELKMLEEVHKGETYAPAARPHMLLFAFHDYISVYFCAASPSSATGSRARNNVVSLLDCVRKDDRTSLIFEFVEGRDFVKDLPTFSEMHIARYMRELFIALAHVHRSAAAEAGLSSVLSHAYAGLKSFTEMSSRIISCSPPPPPLTFLASYRLWSKVCLCLRTNSNSAGTILTSTTAFSG